jgi:hypothetical protein
VQVFLCGPEIFLDALGHKWYVNSPFCLFHVVAEILPSLYHGTEELKN